MCAIDSLGDEGIIAVSFDLLAQAHPVADPTFTGALSAAAQVVGSIGDLLSKGIALVTARRKS